MAEVSIFSLVPYALYRLEGFVSANLARKTAGFSESDLELLWEAFINMFEHDLNAARGKLTARELIVFKHRNELGCASAQKLFISCRLPMPYQGGDLLQTDLIL